MRQVVPASVNREPAHGGERLDQNIGIELYVLAVDDLDLGGPSCSAVNPDGR
jgi:hypothetical protein